MAKILFVVPFLSGGGAERVVSIWASGLAELGGDIHLLAFYRVQNEYALSGQVNLHTVAANEGAYARLGGLGKIMGIRRVLKELKPDVVLPFVSYAGILMMLSNMGLHARIVETVRIDPKYEPLGLKWGLLRRIALRLSKRCIVQTESQLKQFSKGLQKRMVVLPNPVSPDFTVSQKIYKETKIRNLIAVGRLEKQKNYEMLLVAFAQAAADEKIYLRVYGEGSLFWELDELIGKLGLGGRVRLCGKTDRIAEALLEADLFVLSSDAEGFPNALMEAMAAGLPCIATDCPTGPAELIANGKNGLLVPAGNADAMNAAILWMIRHPAEAAQMGMEARKNILDRYDASNNTLELLRIIEGSCKPSIAREGGAA